MSMFFSNIRVHYFRSYSKTKRTQSDASGPSSSASCSKLSRPSLAALKCSTMLEAEEAKGTDPPNLTATPSITSKSNKGNNKAYFNYQAFKLTILFFRKKKES